MAISAPESRKTHIVRLWGENKRGERLDDMHADLERMDVIKSAMQLPPDRQWQGVQQKILWDDDPTKDNYSPDGPASRLVDYIKLCDPETQDVNDPEEFIKIPVIRGMKSQGGSGQGEGFMDRFLTAVDNAQLQSAREVEVRRTVHYDTNIDDAAQAAIDDDPALKAYVVDSQDYARDDNSKDDSQYIEQEIPTYLKHKGNSLVVQALGGQTKLLNQYLIDESEPATQKIAGNNGINPPYRLDPFQNIVNVNFGGLAVEFFDRRT